MAISRLEVGTYAICDIAEALTNLKSKLEKREYPSRWWHSYPETISQIVKTKIIFSRLPYIDNKDNVNNVNNVGTEITPTSLINVDTNNPSFSDVYLGASELKFKIENGEADFDGQDLITVRSINNTLDEIIDLVTLGRIYASRDKSL